MHFVLGGGLIFLAYWLCAAPEPDAIVVSPDMARSLGGAVAATGPAAYGGGAGGVVGEYVDEELLVREACKQGIDRADPPIRERLADKMRFLFGGEPPPPTREQLEAYLKANRARFPDGTFEDLTPTLKEQWVAAERNAALRRNLAQLRGQYRIEVPAEVKP